MKRAIVTVSFDVEVTVDETKFTPEFFGEFDANFYSFGDSLREHFKHLAQLAARNVIDGDRPKEFIEGYGPAGDMGITAKVLGWDQEIVEVSAVPAPLDDGTGAA